MGKSQKKIKPPKAEMPLDENAIGNDLDKEISVYRGKVIHYVTELEYLTELAILNYFKLTESDELLKTFVYSFFTSESFGLHTKHSILSYIITNIFPDFREQHPHLLDTFGELITLRNRYAHSKVIRPYSNDYKIYMLAQVKTKRSKPDIHTSLLNEKTLQIFYGKYWSVKTELDLLIKIIRDRNGSKWKKALV